MSDLNDLLAHLPIGDIAKALGVDEASANSAVTAAIPALLGGLDANARDEAGAASLQQALLQHQDRLPDGQVDINAVDTADGDRIVGHVFGDKTDQVAQQLGGLPGNFDSAIIRKLLPMLAPIVMGYIAKRMRGGGGGAQASGGGGLGDLLGGLVRSGMGGGGSGGGGGILDMLGGLLGGGRR